jgi:hypothetical protein
MGCEWFKLYYYSMVRMVLQVCVAKCSDVELVTDVRKQMCDRAQLPILHASASCMLVIIMLPIKP